VGVYLSIKQPELDLDMLTAAAPSFLMALLVVVTYGVGGWIQFGQGFGWAFFQPGRGGVRFVRLQGASWFCLSISLVLPWLESLVSSLECNMSASSLNLSLMASSGMGLIAQVLTVTSLFAFQPPRQPFAWRFFLTHRPDGRAFLYFFLSFQISLACYAILVLWVAEHGTSVLMGQVGIFVFFCCIATSVSLTHGVGGPWLYNGYEAYQPGRGGLRFVLMQFVGWGSFGTTLAIALCRVMRVLSQMPPFVHLVADRLLPWGGAVPLGLLGLFSQLVITLSLVVFEEDELALSKRYWAEARRLERNAFLDCMTGLPADIKARIYACL